MYVNRIISINHLPANIQAEGVFVKVRDSISGRTIQKTQKMVLDASLYFKVRIKSKVKQSNERNSVFPYTSV